MNEWLIIKSGDTEAKSTDITGLIVSVPSIIRPQKRIQVEEIDGRHGDIVTELGYAAYDKQAQVGLYGQYNVDDVMDFFKPSGQVIFSSEPRVYYDYRILQAVELQRVIRFCKGVVTFHVQPYKHSSIEKPVTQTSSSVWGDSMSIENTGNVDAQPILTVRGNGTIWLYDNGERLLRVWLEDEEITIDTERMEAYSGSMLKNRQVLGDYEKFKLRPGRNEIRWSGQISQISVDRYSRWV